MEEEKNTIAADPQGDKISPELGAKALDHILGIGDAKPEEKEKIYRAFSRFSIMDTSNYDFKEGVGLVRKKAAKRLKKSRNNNNKKNK